MALDIYAVEPVDPTVRTREQWNSVRCNWRSPANTTIFTNVISRDDWGGIALPADLHPTGFYAAPFVEWAGATFRFDMYDLHDPNMVDDFAIKLRYWIAARPDVNLVSVGNETELPMLCFNTLLAFANLTVSEKLWWYPEN